TRSCSRKSQSIVFSPAFMRIALEPIFVPMSAFDWCRGRPVYAYYILLCIHDQYDAAFGSCQGKKRRQRSVNVYKLWYLHSAARRDKTPHLVDWPSHRLVHYLMPRPKASAKLESLQNSSPNRIPANDPLRAALQLERVARRPVPS